MKARGSIELKLVMALMVFGLLALAVFALNNYLNTRDRLNFERGQADVQAKWHAANAKAQEDKDRERLAVGKALMVADNARVAADTKATAADQRWKEAVRDSKRKGVPLASCDQPGAPEPARADVAGSGPRPEVGVGDRGNAARGVAPRFSPEFVRQYDTAWTGLDGEPVFEAADGGAGAAGTGAAWVTAEEVRDTHAENARRCSTDRRNFAALITRVKAAAAAVESTLRGAQ